MLRNKAVAVILLGCMISFSNQFLYGKDAEKAIVAARLNSKIVIDGNIDDEAWSKVPAVSDFTQFDPEEGARPTERTEIKVLFDDDALYVSIMCYDSTPSAIQQQLTRRDRTSQSDRLSVIIDSYHDYKTAFLFSGSVSGVVSDGVLSQDGLLYDVQWDAVWEFKAQIQSNGWSGEFRIPFSALRFSRQDYEYVWGINFRRYIARKKETDEWVMVPRSDVPPGTISSVSKMGQVVGIKNIQPPKHIDILPYGVIKQSYLSKPDPFPLRKKFGMTGGLDLKVGLGNNFTLDATLNPDFGQVEVDQAVLNLTVFETFYPEKRPFFLEGSQMFNFGSMIDNRPLRMFYSRRIGDHPYAPWGTPANGYYFPDEPVTTSILGAVKVTGRTEGGFTFGSLTASTGNEEGTETDLTGNTKTPVFFAKQAVYQVTRIKQDFEDNSWVGLMTTASVKQGVSSYASGVDWNTRLDEGMYAIDGYIAGSLVTSPQFSDLTGTSGRIGVANLKAEHWLGFSFYDFTSKKFNINDLGYFSQPRDHGGYTEVIYKEDRAEAPLRRYSVAVQSNYRWNWEGDNTVAELEFEPTVEFRNFWSVAFDYIQKIPAYDDANKGINGLYLRPAGNAFTLTVKSDIRQSVVGNLVGGIESSTQGMNWKYVVASLTIRPTTWMQLEPGFTYSKALGEVAWVIPQFTENGNNLFGERDVDYRDLSLRGTITFTPSFSVQFFTQVLLAKIHYENFKELNSSSVLTPYDVEQSTTFYPPDFNEQVLNANVVLRWEYLPGSTAYLVWTQARTGYRGLYSSSFGEIFDEAFRLPMDNVILLKLSYFWSL